MPSPKGAYTPSRGILAGRSFPTYFAYQQARSQALGFSSYSAERRQKLDPMFQALYQRARSNGVPRNRALSDIGQFMRDNPSKGGYRKSKAIAFAIDWGYIDDYDQDDDDWVPY